MPSSFCRAKLLEVIRNDHPSPLWLRLEQGTERFTVTVYLSERQRVEQYIDALVDSPVVVEIEMITHMAIEIAPA